MKYIVNKIYPTFMFMKRISYMTINRTKHKCAEREGSYLSSLTMAFSSSLKSNGLGTTAFIPIFK